jgi:DMSO/TMAO reductase YedYZ heme-binding membrane subunit
MSGQLWWYVARAGGIVAWGLLAASVLWGLAMSTRSLPGRPRPSWMLDLHRFLGGLALVFVGVHAAALLLDSYIAFGLTDLLVPFASPYRATAVAWGVVGLYLLIAVEVTSLLRSRLPRWVWRRTHLLSFPLFVTSTLHGVQAGTDAGGGPLLAAMLIVSAAVVGLTALRIGDARRRAAQPTPARIPPRPSAASLPTTRAARPPVDACS